MAPACACSKICGVLLVTLAATLAAEGGIVTTLAGSGTQGFADGTAMTARFYYPSGVAVTSNGSVVVADTGNNRIRLVAPDGTVTTLTGSGTQGFADGTATTAQFNLPYSVAVMQNGSVVVADMLNNQIRLVAPDGTVTTLAGSGAAGFADGPATTAQFHNPYAVAIMPNGSVVVADQKNQRIRLVAPDGTVTTLTGSGTGSSSPGAGGYPCGFADGNATTAQFYYPRGVAAMSNGSVVVADTYNNRIRLVSPDGIVTTLAGNGTAGNADGPAMTARFNAPHSVAVMQNGNMVVADTYNNLIRLVFLNGEGNIAVMTVAAASSQGVAVMSNGNVVVGDPESNRIQLIDATALTLCTTEANCNSRATSVSGTLSGGCSCTCSTAYTGATCNSCSAFYTGYPTCTPIACANSTDCNGHASYVNGTLVSGCTCTCWTTYSGAACNSCSAFYTDYPTCTPVVCANSTDCNGHASYVNGTLVSGCTCACSSRYSGATCDSCSAFYTGYPTCTPIACANSTDCNGHASYVNGTLVSGCTCACSSRYSGATCDSCSAFYTGYPTCTPIACANSTDCNGHASHVNGTLVSGCTCTCWTTYSGAACNSCSAFYTDYPTCTPIACANSTDCNGHASHVNGTLVSGCTCACSSRYSGASCDSCSAFYTGYPTCTPVVCANSTDCNGHASSVSGTLVSGCTCTCSTGYGGATCSSCAAYYTGYPTCTPTACANTADCSGHASSVNGTLVSGCTCTCSAGYSGATCSSCSAFYTGYPTCTPTACANSTDCNGHASSVSGTLVSGCTCTCSTGYTGANCSSCSTYYTGYPACTLTLCGTNVTLTSQLPAMKLLSASLSQDNADVSMLLSAKAKNSVVVVYQRDVDSIAPTRQLAGISRNDFSLYATCAAAPTAIRVVPDGNGTVTYSHSVDYTLCEQGTTDQYVVITCAFAVEHYVWPATEYVPLMTVSEAPITIRVPRTLEQTIEAERFTFQIFPGLFVATARSSANRIRSFTLVQSSSWIAGSSMCTLSTDALSFSCMLHPMAAEGQHNAQFQVVFVNDEAASVGVPVSVRTHYIGKYVPNMFGRSVAIHFTTTNLQFGPSEALVFLYRPHNTAVYGNSTYLSALFLVNGAGDSISVMNNSAGFSFTSSNVSATNLVQCSFLPAAASRINRQFDASNANFTLRATFSFEAPSSRRDTEDVLLTTGLTIGHSTTASQTTMIVIVVVACSVVVLLILGVVVYVYSQRREVKADADFCAVGALQNEGMDAPKSPAVGNEATDGDQNAFNSAHGLSTRIPPVTWPSDTSDECAVAVVKSLFDFGGSFQTSMRQVVGYRLCSVDIVRNELVTGFTSHLTRLKNLRDGDAALFHFECQCDEQREVLSTLKSLFHPVPPGTWRDPHTLTVYHGCRASAARKIAKSGFMDLASLDAGYFGNGIYVTPNAEYACWYALEAHHKHSSRDEQYSPEHPDWFPILLCTAAVGLVYPVTREVDYTPPGAHSDLHGQPLKKPFDAHFALVSHSFGYEAAPPAVAQYGELCVSQYAAVLPLAILWVSNCI